MNVLVLSCGTRNKIIQYFKQTLHGQGLVITTDCNSLAPALYDADKSYIVPRIDDPSYIDVLLGICQKEHVSGVLSLIDPELSLLAKHQEKFIQNGTMVIGSSYELCERSLNKYDMYVWLKKHNYQCARSYIDQNELFCDIEMGALSYPVIVKPVCGSASLSVHKVFDQETVKFLFSRSNDLIIQEFLIGQEIGADVYIDMISGEVVSIFTKKKIIMRSGETDKSVSFKDSKLFQFIEEFVIENGYRGQIDIDLFEIDGQYYISEVNPRFGGGYLHAFECGLNHMDLILHNLRGEVNVKNIGDYEDGIYMMKYNEVLTKKQVCLVCGKSEDM